MEPTSTMSSSPEQVVRAVLDGVCRAVMGDTSAFERVSALYADPTNVRHPLQPDLPPLITRSDFARHAGVVAQRVGHPDAQRAVDVVVHQTTDPETVVTEFRYETDVNGATRVTPCVWVTRVRNGKIVEARDYNGTAHPA